MDQDHQPDMAEFFNFAAASMPDENGQLDVAIPLTTSDMFDPLVATQAAHNCPVHPDGIEYVERPFLTRASSAHKFTVVFAMASLTTSILTSNLIQCQALKAHV